MVNGTHQTVGNYFLPFLQRERSDFIRRRFVSDRHREIHVKLETAGHEPNPHAKGDLLGTVIQIALLDIVFSLDSVITAVAMAKDLAVMIAAVTISVLVMLLAAGTISRFVGRHPTIKMLALAFLILIGVVLVADGLGQHIERGYIYFAMAFSTIVEMLNIRVRSRR
jgi:predicted tellurium resistance membrane protein TerC